VSQAALPPIFLFFFKTCFVALMVAFLSIVGFDLFLYMSIYVQFRISSLPFKGATLRHFRSRASDAFPQSSDFAADPAQMLLTRCPTHM